MQQLSMLKERHSPRSHHIGCNCCVSELLFGIQEWVAIQNDVSIIAIIVTVKENEVTAR